MDLNTRLAQTVKIRRKALGLNQKALADLAGCHFMFISDLEQGKKTLRLDKVDDVLRVLGLQFEIVEAQR